MRSLITLLLAASVAASETATQTCVDTSALGDATASLGDVAEGADVSGLTDVLIKKVEDLLIRTDANNDCHLSSSELTSMFSLLGIDPLENNICVCTSVDQLVDEYAVADPAKGLAPGEILGMAAGRMDLGKKIIFALVGAPDRESLTGMMDSITDPPAAIKSAGAAVEVTFETSQGTLYASDKTTLQNYFADLWVVDAAAIIIATKAAAASDRRKLATATTVEVTGLVADAAAADAASSAATSALADTSTASQLLGMPVTSVPVGSTRKLAAMGNIPFASAGIFAILILLFVNCCYASSSAKKKRVAAGVEPLGCCKTGCCGYYALPAWGKASGLSAVLILIAGILMYLPLAKMATSVKCLIEQILALSNLPLEQLSSLGAMLPTALLDMVTAYIDFLPIVVLLPSILSAIFLVIQFCCAHNKCKTNCCFKFAAFLTLLFLLISAIMGLVCTAIGIVLYIPMIQEQLSLLTSVCETTVPTLKQLSNDISGIPASALPCAISNIPDDSLCEAARLMAALPQAIIIIETVCPCIYDLLDSFTSLLFPGLFLVAGSIYGMWCSLGACCTSCCATKGQVAPEK